MRVKYSDVLERMKKSADLKNDSRLARLLGVTPQALSNYKKRSKVPSDLLIKFADMQGLSVDWLLSGEGARHRAGFVGDRASSPGIVEEENAFYGTGQGIAASGLINFAALTPDELIYVGRLIKVLRSAEAANAAVLKWTIDAFERAIIADDTAVEVPPGIKGGSTDPEGEPEL